jgi:hypothetical protein
MYQHGVLFGCGSPVLIYREDDRRINTREALAEVTRTAAADSVDLDAALSLLIDVAELEAGIIDRISPDRDNLDPLACDLRTVTLAAADSWRRLARGDRATSTLREALDRVSRHLLPDTVRVGVSEGYAYYALFPETYAISAERFWNATRPPRVAVIGIRSIGTSLSAIVVQTLRALGCETWSCTVRPHGHPFDRRLALAPTIEAAWRAEAARGAVFAIVDEGPGLSGSSFASVAHTIRALDVPADRIVLFPSWNPDPESLKSGAAQDTWRTHHRWCTDASATSVSPEAVFGIAEPVVDLSAGAWRSALLCNGDAWPAVQPQHERWKVLVPSEQHVVRFAGLGRYGRSARNRAERLNDLGLGPEPGRLRHGFLEVPFVPGQPLMKCRDQTDAREIGRYVGTIARAFPANAPADTSALEHLIDTNVRELLDPSSADRVRAASATAPRDLSAAFIDGRMLAHEWIRTGAGLAKVDALDHHRDHFYPGIQSAAWDLAGSIVEMQMDRKQSAAMLTEYERVSGDRRARQVLPFYKVAYAAFRAGYAAVAAAAVADTGEARRFARAREYYVRSLTAPSVP